MLPRLFGSQRWNGPSPCCAGVLVLMLVHPGCAHGPERADAGGAPEAGLELSVHDLPDSLPVGKGTSFWVELKNRRKEKLFFSDAQGANYTAEHEADGSGHTGTIRMGPHECRDRLMNKHVLLPGQSYFVAHEIVPRRAGKVNVRVVFHLEVLDEDGSCSGQNLRLETEQRPIVIQ